MQVSTNQTLLESMIFAVAGAALAAAVLPSAVVMLTGKIVYHTTVFSGKVLVWAAGAVVSTVGGLMRQEDAAEANASDASDAPDAAT